MGVGGRRGRVGGGNRAQWSSHADVQRELSIAASSGESPVAADSDACIPILTDQADDVPVQ